MSPRGVHFIRFSRKFQHELSLNCRVSVKLKVWVRVQNVGKMLVVFLLDIGKSMNQQCTKSLSLLDSAESVIEHFFKIACFPSSFQTLIAKCWRRRIIIWFTFQDAKESFKISHGLMFCSSHSKPRLQGEEEQVGLHFKTLK
jgi:hypothetical protein